MSAVLARLATGILPDELLLQICECLVADEQHAPLIGLKHARRTMNLSFQAQKLLHAVEEHHVLPKLLSCMEELLLRHCTVRVAFPEVTHATHGFTTLNPSDLSAISTLQLVATFEIDFFSRAELRDYPTFLETALLPALKDLHTSITHLRRLEIILKIKMSAFFHPMMPKLTVCRDRKDPDSAIQYDEIMRKLLCTIAELCPDAKRSFQIVWMSSISLNNGPYDASAGMMDLEEDSIDEALEKACRMDLLV